MYDTTSCFLLCWKCPKFGWFTYNENPSYKCECVWSQCPCALKPSVNHLLCLYHLSRVADDVSHDPEGTVGVNDQRPHDVSHDPEGTVGVNDRRTNDVPSKPEAASCIKDSKER